MGAGFSKAQVCLPPTEKQCCFLAVPYDICDNRLTQPKALIDNTANKRTFGGTLPVDLKGGIIMSSSTIYRISFIVSLRSFHPCSFLPNRLSCFRLSENFCNLILPLNVFCSSKNAPLLRPNFLCSRSMPGFYFLRKAYIRWVYQRLSSRLILLFFSFIHPTIFSILFHHITQCEINFVDFQ